MVFSSIIFCFFFLPVVLALYAVSPRPAKNAVLLFASLLFYAWGEGWLVLLLLASTGLNYWVARVISIHRQSRSGIVVLACGICANLGLLAYYKYANFIVEAYNQTTSLSGFGSITWDQVSLPIGISFFTFQSISYLVDVHRKAAEAQPRFIDAALYIALFPQLIAGPIVRYHDVDQQLRNRSVTLGLFSDGIRRFIIGLGKKVLIADPLGFVADEVFSIPGVDLTWQIAWLGSICYTLQIYFDFSGYSDMAIGLGRMFGFRFLENFNYPYISGSIREFWTRWHISLSNWFRDYLYVPLGGNRTSKRRLYMNLVLVFVLCGLWHGANWTFIVWGLHHGFFLVVERMGLGRVLERLWRPFQHLYVLLVVIFGWVLFRSDDFSQAFDFLHSMLGLGNADPRLHPIGVFLTKEVVLALAIGIPASIGAYHWLVPMAQEQVGTTSESRSRTADSWQTSRVVEAVYLIFVLIVVCLYLAAGTYSPFIYFRF